MPERKIRAQGFKPVMLIDITLNPYTECQDCGWKCAEHPNAANSAKSHVRMLGHRVIVVNERRRLYGPDTG